MGISYFHIPVSWESPEVEKLKLFFEIIKSLYRKKKILVHCVKNYRASVFVYKFQTKILKNGAKFIAPKEFVPNEVWKKFKDM